MDPHYQDDNLSVHKIKCGPYDNNAYLLICTRTNESIVIDAPAEPEELIGVASMTTVKSIIITHNHIDHISGLDQVMTALDAPVGISEEDSPGLDLQADFFLHDNVLIKAGFIALETIFTPGHTRGSTCFSIGKHVFTGDTLFPGGPGKTKTPEDLTCILESITDRLLQLPDETVFYPGHGSDGSIKVAKDEYSFFATREHPIDLCGDVAWLGN